MKPVAIACLLLCVSPTLALAQAKDPARHSYCQVEDTGKREIWVSQVFPTPPGTDILGTAMATEFHRHVGTLGGAGNKNCTTAVSRAAAEETRAKIAAILGKRSFGIRVYRWHDVDWSPSAATDADATQAAAAGPSFVYCRLVDTDKRVLLTSAIFVHAMPAKTDAAFYQELVRLGSAFGARAAAAEGVNPAGALCIGSDTAAEAGKSRTDYRKSFPFSGIRKVELDFAPGPAPAPASEPMPAAAVATPAPPTAGASSTTPARPTSDDVDRLVSSGAFFQVPAGTGDVLRRSGSRIVNKTVPVTTDTRLQRTPGGNECRLEQETAAGEGGMFRTASSGTTWAGLVPLRVSGKSTSKYGVADTALVATRFDKLVGQPFPLSAGNAFGFTVMFDSTNTGTGVVTPFGQEWACTVGATSAASASIPGMRGEQTELHCRAGFVALDLPPQESVILWYSAAGCFIQDPGR